MIEKVQIKDATLYLGDCAEVLAEVRSVDAVVTDPPYGIGIASNPVRQMHERKEWDAKPADMGLINAIIHASTHQIIWGGNYFDLPPNQCFLIWDKKQPENFSLAMCEMAWCSLKKPAKMFRFSVTSYEKDHPTQKPVPLMEWCIEQLPTNCRTILDPFMGSGTTGVAAAMLGRSFIGIEREPEYFEIACKRIAAAYDQPDLFVMPTSPEPAKAADLFSYTAA